MPSLGTDVVEALFLFFWFALPERQCSPYVYIWLNDALQIWSVTKRSVLYQRVVFNRRSADYFSMVLQAEL
jgi:hypothetical protein